jgi:hypothetical protein
MGGWAIAEGPILGTTITMERLAKRGYESLFSYYEKVSPQFNEPLYKRPARTYSGHAYAEASADKCERRSPSANAGGAVYSISGRFMHTRSSQPLYIYCL